MDFSKLVNKYVDNFSLSSRYYFTKDDIRDAYVDGILDEYNYIIEKLGNSNLKIDKSLLDYIISEIKRFHHAI